MPMGRRTVFAAAAWSAVKPGMLPAGATRPFCMKPTKTSVPLGRLVMKERRLLRSPPMLERRPSSLRRAHWAPLGGPRAREKERRARGPVGGTRARVGRLGESPAIFRGVAFRRGETGLLELKAT